MARPKKQTVDYFPHMCNHGKTMYILEQKYGNDGYAFWFKLLELLGISEGHVIDCRNEATWEFLQAKTRLSEDRCNEILDLLAKLEAIDPELWSKRVIWSENFVNGVSVVYRNRRVDIPTRPSFYIQKPDSADVSTSEKPQSRVEYSRAEYSKEEGAEKDSTPTPETSPTERLVLHELKQVESYPFDVKKDLEHIRALAVDYPTIDLLAEAKKWRVYKLDKPLKKKSNPRSQFRNWCANAAKWQEERSDRNGRSGSTSQGSRAGKYADLVIS